MSPQQARERARAAVRQLAGVAGAATTRRRARRALAFALDGLGLGLIAYAAWLWSPAVGFLVAGVIALGVAALASPAPDPAAPQAPDGDGTEGAGTS